MKPKHIYIQPETDAALSKLGGATRAENIRRAVALAEVAEDMAFWLNHCTMERISSEIELNLWEVLARYKEAKQ